MKQITVVCKDRAGLVADIASALGANGINIETLDAESENKHGIVALSVSGERYDEALKLLRDADIPAFSEDAMIVGLKNRPGALAELATKFKHAGINLRSLRIVHRETESSLVSISVGDRDSALKIISELDEFLDLAPAARFSGDYFSTPAGSVFIESGKAKIGVDPKTGWIVSCIFKDQNFDLFRQLRQDIPGYIAALRIYDERERRFFDEMKDDFSLSDFKSDGKSISFIKHFSGAAWKIHTQLRFEGDFLEWNVNILKTSESVSDRSLRIHFAWPLIAGWDFWAPAHDSEFTFDGMSSFEYMYIQTPCVGNREIILPMVSHFNRKLDAGFSVLEPIDAKVPAAKFQFSNAEKCFNWGAMKKDPRSLPMLETVNYYVGLVGDSPLNTSIRILFHEGDWRSGLGKVFEKWNDHFVPHCENINEFNGVFDCASPEAANDVERFKGYKVKTLEVHGHFENYGDYFQAGKDEWFTIAAKESIYRKISDPWKLDEFLNTHGDNEIQAVLDGLTPDDPNIASGRLRYSRRDIKEKLGKLKSMGVGAYWYINYSDGYKPVVEIRWPDSICKREDGSLLPSGWKMCHNMNPDPKWSFGRFQIESVKSIISEYPTIAGFFLDCFRHMDIDFAHSDGITVVNNKPAYSINFSYDEIGKIISAELMRENNKASFANKPLSIRTMRWVDGVLLEGDGEVSEEKYFWACLAKPLFFMWTSGKKSLDENLRRAVLHGAFPRFTREDRGKISSESLALYRKYLPLCEQFKGRVFCFDPDPLRPPHGARAKLYTLNGDYIAAIISDSISENMDLHWKKTPCVTFRVSRACDVAKVGLMLPGNTEFTEVPFKFDGTFIRVPMEGYSNCAVIKLFVEGDSGRKIGKASFPAVMETCMDPESAFSGKLDE